MAARLRLMLVVLVLLVALLKPTPALADHDVHFYVALARANIDPAWSPDSRTIAYASSDFSKSQEFLVQIMGPDGDQQGKLTSGTVPLWAPDGRSVAFIRPWAIWIARTGGGEVRVVPWRENYANDLGGIFRIWSVFGRPYSWSPDSSQIVFDDAKGILVVNANGGSPRTLAGDEDAFGPVWSPDGQRVAFTHYRERSGVPQIHVVNIDGSGRRSLTGQRGGWAPTWSPDGGRIAFVAGSSFDAGLEIYVMNADGSSQTKVATRGDIAMPAWGKVSFFFGYWPGVAWSPDGRRLAFHAMYADPDGKRSMQIFVIGADGTGLKRLTSGRHYWAPVWSPDGRIIVFSGMDATAEKPEGQVPIHIYAVRTEGSELIPLTGRK